MGVSKLVGVSAIQFPRHQKVNSSPICMYVPLSGSNEGKIQEKLNVTVPYCNMLLILCWSLGLWAGMFTESAVRSLG